LKIAIVHDYLNQAGGAERVVEVFHRMYPEAPIYTTIIDRSKLYDGLKDADIRITWMQRLPGILKHFKKYFMLYPLAIRSMDLREFDLIISSSSAYAKGIKKGSNAVHVCYCYTPMRFVWDYENYLKRENLGPVVKRLLPVFIKLLKKWDIESNKDVDYFIAISNEIKQRIEKFYHRDAQIIFPPVNVANYYISDIDEDYYLIVSRLAPYKRIDLAIEAFNKSGKKLVVIGSGPAKQQLQKKANNNITFMGRLTDEEVAKYMSRCRAFIFPGKEDFGLTPLEANASGRPVVAFKGGGTLDTVKDGVTGVYFEGENPDEIVKAVERLESLSFDKNTLRKHAEKFNDDKFIYEISKFISSIEN
jgi:glycosyltransferase involved in cell wall biosynthesis